MNSHPLKPWAADTQVQLSAQHRSSAGPDCGDQEVGRRQRHQPLGCPAGGRHEHRLHFSAHRRLLVWRQRGERGCVRRGCRQKKVAFVARDTDQVSSSAALVGPDGSPAGVGAARAAFSVGVVYALVSAYWGTGGTGLLHTIGGALERAGRAHTAGLLAVLWITVALKLTAAAAGLAATGPVAGSRRRRRSRIIAWMAAVVLVVYGAVLTAIGLLVQAGVVSASARADQTALRWHAYLWDPWFCCGEPFSPRRFGDRTRVSADPSSRPPLAHDHRPSIIPLLGGPDKGLRGAEAFPRTDSGVGDELEQGSVRVVEVDAVADPERSLAFDRPFDDRD